MNRYKLDYFTPTTNNKVSSRGKRSWVTMMVFGICLFCLTLLLFGGIGTNFQDHGERKSLRQQHDELSLRYDSLFAAKLQTEKQLIEARQRLRILQKNK
ncbi:MAG: hypothetical protein R2822_24080 [Spirosomataceae bacterium]